MAAIASLLLGVIAVVVVLIRRGDRDDEYDEDDYFEEDDYDEVPKAPVTPTQSYSEPTVSEQEYVAEDDGITVDEDGTKWYEDDAGTWWCLDPGMEDVPENWYEWTE